MDFMKVFDQTVREIKREVNLKVLKVPEMEQRVLDATDDEPWGPHGSALAEIAQATKKFTECQMVMNVLWTRLKETDRNWRFVYKSLAVIEYLVAHGSDRAVDDIIEHSFQISSLSSFQYIEPNGKDMGINVRKKVETIVALLNNKEKIKEVRNKAAANRDKYVGLSSTGISSKSSSASFGSSSLQSSDGFKGFGGTREGDTFKESYGDNDRFGESKFDKHPFAKSSQGVPSKNQENGLKKGSTRRKDQDILISGASKQATRSNDHDKYTSVPPQSSSAPSDNYEDGFDDFDPRGTSGAKSAAGNSNKVDLFGQDLIGDLMDAPASVPSETSTNFSEVDLFAEATFVSASPHVEAGGSSETQNKVNLFASQPDLSPPISSSVDLFAVPDPVVQPDSKSSKSETMSSNAVDPFAAVPLNNFDGSDPFGEFTAHTNSSSTEPAQNPFSSHSILNAKPSADSKPAPSKKDTFQVKSGIWADSLTRGLIDLNIAAPKKVSLTDIGIVGGLSDGSAEKEKGPPTSFYTGPAMGAGSGLGKSGFTSSTAMDGDDFFSSLSNQQYQFGGFQK